MTWPDHYGDIPDPRAAHSVVRSAAHGLFLFGGRVRAERINDLYYLDLSRMRWTKLRPPASPPGRTWHSLTKLSDDKALMYGGYNTALKAMKDCWMLDMTEPELLGKSRWKQCSHLELKRKGKRLWHQAVLESSTGQVWVMGGLAGDLLSQDYFPSGKRPKMIRLSPSPLPLLHLAMMARLKHSDITPEEEACLPDRVQKVMQMCRSDGA